MCVRSVEEVDLESGGKWSGDGQACSQLALWPHRQFLFHIFGTKIHLVVMGKIQTVPSLGRCSQTEADNLFQLMIQ